MLTELGFNKFGKILNVSDIEDHMGYYFPDKEEPMVRDLVRRQYDKSFALRHPLVAGIPTLGIWPAIAKGQAMDNVTRSLYRRDAKYQTARKAVLDAIRQRDLEEARLQIEADKANAIPRAAGALGASYLYGKALDKE